MCRPGMSLFRGPPSPLGLMSYPPEIAPSVFVVSHRSYSQVSRFSPLRCGSVPLDEFLLSGSFHVLQKSRSKRQSCFRFNHGMHNFNLAYASFFRPPSNDVLSSSLPRSFFLLHSDPSMASFFSGFFVYGFYPRRTPQLVTQ